MSIWAWVIDWLRRSQAISSRASRCRGFVHCWKRALGIIAAAAAVCGLLAGSADAFLRDLSQEQVREASYLGRDPERRQAFFDRYIHYPKQPDTGPDVHLIEFRTPYEMVARRSQERWANYDVLDAEQEYERHPGEVVVRVLICGTYTFGFGLPPENPPPGVTWEDFLQGFDFRVSQTSPIRYEKLTVVGAGCASFDGVEALLHFDADQFEDGIVRVEMVTPGEHVVSTKFDLDSLK